MHKVFYCCYKMPLQNKLLESGHFHSTTQESIINCQPHLKLPLSFTLWKTLEQPCQPFRNPCLSLLFLRRKEVKGKQILKKMGKLENQKGLKET